MDSSKLATFAAFADDPNLSRTAKRLHLSQPAVHAQLKLLAEEVGVALYRREGRGLVLTAEGTEVAAYARAEAARARDLVARLRGEAADAPLVVAAGAGAIVHLLAPGLRAFGRGKRRLEVVTADATQAIELVRRGDAHVGVAVTANLPSDLVASTLVSAAQVAVVRKSDPLARRRTLRLADLAAVPLVFPPEGGPQRTALDAAFGTRGIAVHIAAIARGWDVVLRLVEVGIGVGIVNATCVVPRSLVTRPLHELPRITYLAFTRASPRPAIGDLVRALISGVSERDRPRGTPYP